MHYELWDTETANLLDDFDTEAQAVETVQQLIELNGPGTTDDLALVHVADGRTTTIALGPALDTYVRQAGAEQPRRRA